MDKICVLVPTYREEENIGSLIEQLLELGPGYRVVVSDDNSPDETGVIVRKWADETGRVVLLTRKGARGRGVAGFDGFRRCVDEDCDYVVEMDADFSHHPREIPKLVEVAKEVDIAVGSRFVDGASNDRPGAIRNLITWGARLVIRIFHRVKLKDPTSGFRCYRREALELILDRGPLISPGPSIVEEVQYKGHLLGLTFREVPITFEDREKGRSQFNFRLMVKVFFYVVLFPWIFGHLRDEYAGSVEVYPGGGRD